jgi:uncharacterized membrane protein
MILFIEIIGWIGSVLVLIAYFLNLAGKLSAESLTYKLLNIFGSIFLIIITFYKEAWQSMAVNVIWAAIALVLLFKKDKKNETQKA